MYTPSRQPAPVYPSDMSVLICPFLPDVRRWCRAVDGSDCRTCDSGGGLIFQVCHGIRTAPPHPDDDTSDFVRHTGRGRQSALARPPGIRHYPPQSRKLNGSEIRRLFNAQTADLNTRTRKTIDLRSTALPRFAYAHRTMSDNCTKCQQTQNDHVNGKYCLRCSLEYL